MQKRFGVLLPALCFLFSLAATAQMLDPAIDRDDEPFSYFSQPTDVIGVMDARAGTLVSPEGYFYTGFGELMFFTGNPSVPLHQRVKTLYHGYLPILSCIIANRCSWLAMIMAGSATYQPSRAMFFESRG